MNKYTTARFLYRVKRSYSVLLVRI